jgi:predicted DNA-binding transcriptional regulator YafY
LASFCGILEVMRADRLVAALLVLQARGRVTAAELAEELEISERTARRDLEALAASGVPVYSQAGRGGGWSLIGGARTDLSGLTAAEAQMLFLVAGPSSHATPQVKAALRKLVRALPERFRAGAQAAASAVVIDPASWDRTSAPPPEHLGALQTAVVEGVQAVIVYASAGSEARERVVHPLGLVVKGTVWYLVAGTDDGLRTFRVNRVRSVELTQRPVERPDDFDLAEHWRSVMSELDERRAPVRVKLRAAPHALGWLRAAFGTRMRTGDTDADGKVDVEVRAHSPFSATAELAGFGANIEVLEPDDVRGHLARVGAELTSIYASG